MFVAVALALAAALAPGTPRARPHETSAERLHRRGVFCMEEIERTDCAIEKFQALLRERTSRTDLQTDAMLRLITLHRAAGDTDALAPLLRRFWELGGGRRQVGHVPFLALRLPGDVDVMTVIAIRKILQAPITRAMHKDAAAWVTTCDPGTRELLSERLRWKRAEVIARRENRATIDVIYEQTDRARARQATRPPPTPASDQPAPIFRDAMCSFARALGQSDVAGWTRLALAMSHRDFSRSYVVVEIPSLGALVERAVREGRLRRVRDGIYQLPNTTYRGQPVQVAALDLNQAVLTRAALIPELERTRARPRSTLSPALRQLLGEIPRASPMFFVMTEQAIGELGLGTMPKLLRALLPRPKGLQVATVIDRYFGVFARMPSDNVVKGQVVVSLAQRMIEPDDDLDPETAELFQNLDLSQAKDGRALLMSFVLDPGQVRRIFFY